MGWLKWLTAGLALTAVTAPGAGWVSLDRIAATASPLDQRHRLLELARTMEQPAVNAKVDRVWHAIPGLNGWTLDVPASEQATRQDKDGRIHLKWRTVQPEKTLAALPAEPIYRGPNAEKSVCLMFNVSWGEAYIPGLLRTLEQQGIHATFFLDGAWVRQHEDLAKQIAAAGHAIGSHGDRHPDYSRLSTTRIIQNMESANASIAHTLGSNPTLFAPPAGSYDQRTVSAAKERGMYTILWTTDTVDWRKPPAASIVDRVRKGVEPGALILMHPTAPTVEALPNVITQLKASGYRFKTVQQVVQEQRLALPPDTLSRTP